MSVIVKEDLFNRYSLILKEVRVVVAKNVNYIGIVEPEDFTSELLMWHHENNVPLDLLEIPSKIREKYRSCHDRYKDNIAIGEYAKRGALFNSTRSQSAQERDARAHLEKIRFNGEVKCPKCHKRNPIVVGNIGYKCEDCRFKFSLVTLTVFARCKLSLIAICSCIDTVIDNPCISTHELAAKCKITQMTACRLMQKIRVPIIENISIGRDEVYKILFSTNTSVTHRVKKIGNKGIFEVWHIKGKVKHSIGIYQDGKLVQKVTGKRERKTQGGKKPRARLDILNISMNPKKVIKIPYATLFVVIDTRTGEVLAYSDSLAEAIKDHRPPTITELYNKSMMECSI